MPGLYLTVARLTRRLPQGPVGQQIPTARNLDRRFHAPDKRDSVQCCVCRTPQPSFLPNSSAERGERDRSAEKRNQASDSPRQSAPPQRATVRPMLMSVLGARAVPCERLPTFGLGRAVGKQYSVSKRFDRPHSGSGRFNGHRWRPTRRQAWCRRESEIEGKPALLDRLALCLPGERERIPSEASVRVAR